ncbi:hypothetical protein imdm_192 [gamma proteobacterium IMCC2047]|nr:hypothetical protein imdm_192 [gamma proteobacterium IMCC2047]
MNQGEILSEKIVKLLKTAGALLFIGLRRDRWYLNRLGEA